MKENLKVNGVEPLPRREYSMPDKERNRNTKVGMEGEYEDIGGRQP